MYTQPAQPITLTRKQQKLLGQYNDEAIAMGWPTVADAFNDIACAMEDATDIMHDEDACCASCAAASRRVLNDESGEVFHRSSWFEGRLSDMPTGPSYTLNGQVDISKRPYQVDINKNLPLPRAEIAFTHEMLHTLNDTMKWGLTHPQLHDAAVMLTGEVVPGIENLRKTYAAVS